KTTKIQKWKIVKELPEKEFSIENEENSLSSVKNKRYKLNTLKDITNWIKYKPEGRLISIAPEELQRYANDCNTDIQESKIQKIEIKNSSWSEHLIDKILFCLEE